MKCNLMLHTARRSEYSQMFLAIVVALPARSMFKIDSGLIAFCGSASQYVSLGATHYRDITRVVASSLDLRLTVRDSGSRGGFVSIIGSHRGSDIKD